MLRFVWLSMVAFFETIAHRASRGPLRPSWSLEFQSVVRLLRKDWEATSAWEPARLRADIDARPYPQTTVRKVKTTDAPLGGVPTRRFVPPGAKKAPVVLFFHGGSYIYGSARTTHAELLARLAVASGCEVLGVDYRLAPEHAYPAQLEDALAAFDALVASGVPAESIVVAGDSAGGNLAFYLQLALRDRGSPQARSAVLLSPWSDLTMPGESFTKNDPYDYGTRETLLAQARLFAGELPLGDPRLSPTHARCEGLAPVLVVAGEVEIPHDDILTLVKRMKDAGVDVTVHVAKDMPHNPAVFAAYHPSGAKALERMARFVAP